jgi:hypothetical protein
MSEFHFHTLSVIPSLVSAAIYCDIHREHNLIMGKSWALSTADIDLGSLPTYLEAFQGKQVSQNPSRESFHIAASWYWTLTTIQIILAAKHKL